MWHAVAGQGVLGEEPKAGYPVYQNGLLAA